MITRVHHVGVVVRDLPRACAFWRDTLGLPLVKAAEVPDQAVRAALLACGPCEIELLEPTRPGTGVARFLAGRGEGLHHLCLETDDVHREVARLAAAGAELIDRTPRPGLAGLVAFLHPRAGAGVLLELATPPGHEGLPPAPLAVEAIGLAVDDVAAALARYGALLELGRDDLPAGAGRIELGGVALEFAAGAGGASGLTGLRLVGGAPGWLPEALRSAAAAGPGGLELPAAVAGGVPLVIRPW